MYRGDLQRDGGVERVKINVAVLSMTPLGLAEVPLV